MPELAILRSPDEVLFGRGMAGAVGRVAGRYGQRALVVTDAGIAATNGFRTVAGALEVAGLDIEVFDEAVVDVPMSTVEQAVARARGLRPDAVVAVGGGSVIDLAKATALLLSHPGPISRYYGEHEIPGPVMPVIALPTTAGTGSEVTPVAVIADPELGMKVGVSSPFLIPRTAICDPLLTVDAPAQVTAYAGIDALSHAVEAFMAVERSPEWQLPLERVAVGKNALSDAVALVAIRAIAPNLERAVRDGGDLDARNEMLYGSLTAGLAFANAGVSAAHALQFAVGAATGTPHGLGTGLLLPYVMAFNRPQRQSALDAIAAAIGDPAADPVTAVHRLGLAIGLPTSLAELGIGPDRIPEMAEQAAGIRRLAGNNPRDLDAAGCEAILDAAWHGEPTRLYEPAPA
ncbi:MAG TPA: iron-containing alcohol dehydrogenase [Solirubrobacterales bacterium]|nr:iron-containing alcohol dehydrogenase [Solirubrobacterales bacterium]